MTSNFSAILELLDTDLHHIISFLARFDDLENQPQVHRGQNFGGLAQDGAGSSSLVLGLTMFRRSPLTRDE